jgi:hypothetical protein
MATKKNLTDKKTGITEPVSKITVDNKRFAGKKAMSKKKTAEKPKSKITLFREKYPNGILKIVDMDAVLE